MLEMITENKCEACNQPFNGGRRAAGRQSFCSSPECQRERRRRSQRGRRAAKSDSREQKREASIGGENCRQLHLGVKPPEAEVIPEDPFILGLMSMLCDTHDLKELQTTISKLRKRGMEIKNQKF